MTRYLLAGGGTAGHVNPLLATADEIRRRDARASIVVVGTAAGLEARLVPDRGYELVTIPKLPFPRRPTVASIQFPSRFHQVISRLTRLIAENEIDIVVGFGGYAAAPAYFAAKRSRTRLVIHEANAKPGLANRLGSRLTPFVGTAFPDTALPHARVVGMPLRREIEDLDRSRARRQAREFFGLLDDRPTVLVTGGSLGARRINQVIAESAPQIIDAGYQVLHIWGSTTAPIEPFLEHYHALRYCDRMELALSVADLAVSRAGAATVSELAALGIPSVLVPYPVGNGEQRFNARELVAAGGALLVSDEKFLPGWVASTMLPLLDDSARLGAMAKAAISVGVRNGSTRMVDLIEEALT